MANAEVRADINLVGAPRATLLASCSPAIVITMKVPPTHTADTATDTRLSCRTGSNTPPAMTTRLQPAIFRGATACTIVETAIVDSAAARPNKGQVQPKTAGSGTRLRATAGRNVAGMM